MNCSTEMMPPSGRPSRPTPVRAWGEKWLSCGRLGDMPSTQTVSPMCGIIGPHISGSEKLDSPMMPVGFHTPVSQGWVWKMNSRLHLPATARAGRAVSTL